MPHSGFLGSLFGLLIRSLGHLHCHLLSLQDVLHLLHDLDQRARHELQPVHFVVLNQTSTSLHLPRILVRTSLNLQLLVVGLIHLGDFDAGVHRPFLTVDFRLVGGFFWESKRIIKNLDKLQNELTLD